MKAKLVLASLVLAASSAMGSVTLQFNTAEGSLQNFANAAGVGGTAMVWGIIIDTADDGFDFNAANTTYDSAGTTYTANTLINLNLLVNGSAAGPSDDVLYLSNLLMNVQAAAADGMPAGTNRVTSIAGLPWGPPTAPNIGLGDDFAVVWFNNTTAPAGGQIVGGTKFGAVVNPGLTIPADGSLTSFATLFTGVDQLKQPTLTWGVPEPSSMLLGLLGAVGLLRRRRN